MENLNDKEMMNEYANFYGNVEEEQMEDSEYSESYLLNDENISECDAESLSGENLMLNNDKLCATYSEDLNNDLESNEHHSKVWKHVNNDLENEISLHSIK